MDVHRVVQVAGEPPELHLTQRDLSVRPVGGERRVVDQPRAPAVGPGEPPLPGADGLRRVESLDRAEHCGHLGVVGRAAHHPEANDVSRPARIEAVAQGQLGAGPEPGEVDHQVEPLAGGDEQLAVPHRPLEQPAVAADLDQIGGLEPQQVAAGVRRVEDAQTEFGANLERTAELPERLPRLADAVRRGLAAPWVRVMLPEDTATAGQPTLRVALERRGEVVGHIECGPKDGGYGPGDRELLDILAGQAATAIANVGLTARLAEQVAELARSRARIVAAQAAERQRIERNTHDGAQQQVVALIMKLRLARNQLARGDRSADEVLDELHDDARELLADLRELAHGIRPLLSDRGLVAEVQARADRLPLDIAVHAESGLRERRLDTDVEGAAYFGVCEALTNMVKHSAADAAGIHLSTVDGKLVVLVHHTGIGLPDGQTNGHGLTNLRDRVEALGGRLMVDGTPGGGTSLHVELPVADHG